MPNTKVIRGQVIEDKKSQWTNKKVTKRKGSGIDETSKNQSHQELLRQLKAQYRSPRSQHGRMLYQYNKDYSSRGRQFLTKFNDDLEPEDSGYRLQLHLEGTDKSDRSRLSMAHPSDETSDHQGENSSSTNAPHEDSISAEVDEATTQANIFSSEEFIRTSTTPSTTRTVATTTSPPEPPTLRMFRGGQRRGMLKEKKKEAEGGNGNAEMSNEIDTGTEGSQYVDSFTKKICAKLKVPCRFVSDHMCCRYRMPLDLVARSRSMDGSADLKWRLKSPLSRSEDDKLQVKFQGPRTLGRSSQGRSLSSMWETEKSKSPREKPVRRVASIRYNHANTKTGVRIPRYFYKGGPDNTHTILGQCWRLYYINCKSLPA